MPIRNTTERWGSFSIALHWITVLLILSLVVVGFVMQELPNTPMKRDVYLLHKSFGLTVLFLTALRLGWRLLQPTPMLPAAMPAWQRWSAKLGHVGLYALMIAIPASGWTYNWASNFVTPYFGWTLMDKAGSVDRDLKALAGDVHEYGVYALLALLVAHAGAAFYHHYQLKDRVL
ncbi:MAG: cytochrome b, partial [Silanimonas sp.]